MANKLRSHGKNMVVWVLLGLLILGLGGFSVTNFAGGNQDIGTVGDTEISMNDYARTLQQEQQAMAAQFGQPISMQQAQALGLTTRVQGQLFGQAAISEQARQIGVSVGDMTLNRQITQAPAFQGLDGSFDREAYRMALSNQGYQESQFEAQMRGDIARSILQSAVVTGVDAPQAEVDAYAAYISETRNVAYAEIEEADLLEPLAQPTDAQLQDWHKTHSDRFMSPETRQISYVWLDPSMLVDTVDVTDDELQQAYAARADQYDQPERRLVERLVYPSLEEATAAKARLDAGEADFATLAQERGLDLSDLDLGDVTKAELGTAGDAIFALTENGVVGPIETDFGPALFRMNGVLEAQQTPFDEVEPELRQEIGLDRARRVIQNQTDSLNDLIAGGATLEEVADESQMELGSLSYSGDSDTDIAGYEAFRSAAMAVTANDFPELQELEDGGVFALRLDGITEAAVIPFAQARDAVAADWRQETLTTALAARAQQVAAAVNDGATLSSTGVLTTDVSDLPRGGYLDGMPGDLVVAAFATPEGQAKDLTAEGRVFVVQPTAVIAADPADDSLAQLRGQIATQLSQTLANDMLDLYARAAQAEAGLTIDQAAIRAVEAQMQ
ncbi:hypothetical protein BFP70_10965 [Thioclava sp. SK-1]|uniref:SurA N-terminal domain-containing protein n=1 Tax=Thioclava sp. SK-1 TaxID=1889770 RepID=UPI00082635CB|nr:SurA N-terminal domain-containing protein [Thioclava sp. SK-1]OCX64549.1 hypothetical protein BFP70_10965 [Thioclava sp. SK-1]